MALVLHHSRARGTAKLVLLGIANHDGDGGAWPSQATLARYANVSERAVRDAVEQLVGLGEVIVKYKGGGMRDDTRRPNLYELRLWCPADCDRSKHHRTKRTATTAPLPLPEAEAQVYAEAGFQVHPEAEHRVADEHPEAGFRSHPEADRQVHPEAHHPLTTQVTNPENSCGLDTSSTTDALTRDDALASIRATLSKPKGERA